MEIEFIDVKLNPIWLRVRMRAVMLFAALVSVPICIDHTALADRTLGVETCRTPY